MPALDSGEPADVRFWRHVASGEPDECWLWTAAVVAGYGVFSSGEYYEHSRRQKPVKAHRFSWALANGEPVPAGMLVCHSCDTPTCVNPRHLFLGTYVDNRQDQIRKGRGPDFRGERHWKAKLTAAKVSEIRQRKGSGPARLVGIEFGVSTQAIYDIWQGRTWNSLTT